MRKYILENEKNIRDIGGYNTKEGILNYDKIIRGENLSNITDNDIKFFNDNNINVIDIRSQNEKEKYPDKIKNNYYSINLKRTRFPKTQKDIPITYMEVLEDYDNIKKILELIANIDDTIYIHCKNGKDRTGIIIMIIMMICNCDDNSIIEEYSKTDYYFIDHYNNYHKENPKSPLWLGKAKAKYMKETLNLFNNKYQNIDNYLKLLNVSNKTITRIKKDLIHRRKLLCLSYQCFSQSH